MMFVKVTHIKQTNKQTKQIPTNLHLCFHHFPSSYSFAIVGINITDLAYSLLVSGALKTHLYNVAPEMPSLLHFQQTFCEFSGLGLINIVLFSCSINQEYTILFG